VVEHGRSVFSRLGEMQNDDSEIDSKDSVKTMLSKGPSISNKRSGSTSIFERLGPESDKVKKEQEACVTSTTNAGENPIPLPRGILKKRGTGDGTGMARSKSAPNIISLKAPTVKDTKKREVKWGADEIKTMEPKPDIKSRLGYGRCASPPPPEISESNLKTEIKKIAIGGGKFEMRKVMKIVNADKTIAEELGRSGNESNSSPDGDVYSVNKVTNLSIAVSNSVPERRPKSSPSSSASSGDYKVDKVDLALRAAKLKVARNQARASEEFKEITDSKPKKRLAKYVTKSDGSVVKEYISYDDPILQKVPIKRKKSDDLDQMIRKTEELKMRVPVKSPVVINKGRVATNFQVVRMSKDVELEEPVDTGHFTLAEKAALSRNRQETEKGDSPRSSRVSFQTLASRANKIQKRSHSPDPDVSRRASSAKMDLTQSSVKLRLVGEKDTLSSSIQNVPGRDRISFKERERPRSNSAIELTVSSRDRSPLSLKNRIGSQEKSSLSVRERLGSGERDLRINDRALSNGGKKIFSRLGPRE